MFLAHQSELIKTEAQIAPNQEQRHWRRKLCSRLSLSKLFSPTSLFNSHRVCLSAAVWEGLSLCVFRRCWAEVFGCMSSPKPPSPSSAVCGVESDGAAYETAEAIEASTDLVLSSLWFCYRTARSKWWFLRSVLSGNGGGRIKQLWV